MSGQRVGTGLTDGDRMDRELRSWLRDQEVPAGYLADVLATTSHTRQRRGWVRLPGWMTEGILLGRPGLTTAVIVALLLAALLGTILVVGAVLRDRLDKTLLADPSLRPAAAAQLVESAYTDMPRLPALQLTLLDQAGGKRRVLVSSSGAVRIETYDSADATTPSSYRILSRRSLYAFYREGSASFWYAQADPAFSEDVRVFVYAETSGPGFPRQETACRNTGPEASGLRSGWRYLGLEQVLGRPTHHVACEGELWIDDATSLVLRSRGPAMGADGRPIPGEIRSIDVTELSFAEPDAALFRLEAPAGAVAVDSATYERHECRASGSCLASPAPAATAQPAGASPIALDPDDLTQLVTDGDPALPAIEIEARRFDTGQVGGEVVVRFLHDGSGRYRIETTFQPDTAWTTTELVLEGADYHYSMSTGDGARPWQSNTLAILPFYRPIEVPASCEAGWQAVSVDLVAGRVADHLSCPTAEGRPELWIDRGFHLVLRTEMDSPSGGRAIEEVVAVRIGPQDEALFELPAGASPVPGRF